MNRAHITTVFSEPPASFQWQEALNTEQPRLLGARYGAAIELDGPEDNLTGATLSAIAPNDDATTARRCGQLLMLLLVAFAPKWHAGHGWAMGCLKTAAWSPTLKQTFTNTHLGWRYELTTDKQRALATLSITKVV